VISEEINAIKKDPNILYLEKERCLYSISEIGQTLPIVGYRA
jgi:hypothetical protein